MAFLTVRPLPPKGHCHYHRPVISFKELIVSCEQLAVSSALTARFKLALQTALKFSRLLTAYCSPLTPKFLTGQLLLRLPRYKDPKACVAGIDPAPRPPGTLSTRAPPRHPPPGRSCAAADESALGLACPSSTADRSS